MHNTTSHGEVDCKDFLCAMNIFSQSIMHMEMTTNSKQMPPQRNGKAHQTLVLEMCDKDEDAHEINIDDQLYEEEDEVYVAHIEGPQNPCSYNFKKRDPSIQYKVPRLTTGEQIPPPAQRVVPRAPD